MLDSALLAFATVCDFSFEPPPLAGLHFTAPSADFRSEICTAPARKEDEILT
jgi:hypothetical protein